MERPLFFLELFISLLLLLLLVYSANSEQEDVKRSLIGFLRKLYSGDGGGDNGQIERDLGWNASTDPCLGGGWKNVDCDNKTNSVRRIILRGLGFRGYIDAGLLCSAPSLIFVSIQGNRLRGGLPAAISNCTQLTHLFLSDNHLSGTLPTPLSRLNNLKKLDVSGNYFSGEVPADIPKISGLLAFLAQNNNLSGSIPQFDFANLQQFNVSHNNFTGPVPDPAGRFNISSFSGNSGLCGKPIFAACPPYPVSKTLSGTVVLMYSGYVLLGLAFVIFFAYKLVLHNKKASDRDTSEITKEEVSSDCSGKPTVKTADTTSTRSEYSIPSSSSSLFVLKNPRTGELRFEDLLRAPADLLGRGRHGSTYKVMFEDGTSMAVKRIKDWSISAEEFQRRMERIDRVKHPNVLPAVAFYRSKQEKLAVYEYQANGSLFKLLHGRQSGQRFEWGRRLSVAANISEGLAFMHKELCEDEISHGNLKSSNILMDINMHPCISEYGLMVINNESLPTLTGDGGDRHKHVDHKSSTAAAAFTADVYGFGVILVELLTGKLVENNELFNLARWVHSVVSGEMNVEVFDKALVSEGVSEERMECLLQVALKCINPSPDARPSINQVAMMIDTMKKALKHPT